MAAKKNKKNEKRCRIIILIISSIAFVGVVASFFIVSAVERQNTGVTKATAQPNSLSAGLTTAGAIQSTKEDQISTTAEITTRVEQTSKAAGLTTLAEQTSRAAGIPTLARKTSIAAGLTTSAEQTSTVVITSTEVQTSTLAVQTTVAPTTKQVFPTCTLPNAPPGFSKVRTRCYKMIPGGSNPPTRSMCSKSLAVIDNSDDATLIQTFVNSLEPGSYYVDPFKSGSTWTNYWGTVLPATLFGKGQHDLPGPYAYIKTGVINLLYQDDGKGAFPIICEHLE